MTEDEALDTLDRLEADLSHDLYRSRWDADYAADVVPLLRDCLGSREVGTLIRALTALRRIGPEAFQAEPEALGMLRHEEPKVRETAVWALSGISLRRPEGVLSHLVEAARDEVLLKPVMFALIEFGANAKPATSLFLRAFESPDHRLRLLAIRGLKEIGAGFDEVERVIREGLTDRSKGVRLAAEKLLRTKWPERYAKLAPGPT